MLTIFNQVSEIIKWIYIIWPNFTYLPLVSDEIESTKFSFKHILAILGEGSGFILSFWSFIIRIGFKWYFIPAFRITFQYLLKKSEKFLVWILFKLKWVLLNFAREKKINKDLNFHFLTNNESAIFLRGATKSNWCVTKQ